MAENTYSVGGLARLYGRFTIVATNTLVDPTTVKVKVRIPTEPPTELTYVFGVDSEVVRISVGYYELLFYPTVWNHHSYRFVGSGAAVAAAEKKFFVEKTAFTTPT